MRTRRANVHGGCYLFTLVTERRRKLFFNDTNNVGLRALQKKLTQPTWLCGANVAQRSLPPNKCLVMPDILPHLHETCLIALYNYLY